MISGSLARRYARALLDLGLASRSADGFGRELERLVDLVNHSQELRSSLENPIFKLSNRRAVLEEIVKRLGVSKPVRNFVMLLLDRQRIASLPAIAREYRRLADEAANRLRVTVTSARALDPGLEMRLKGALEKKTGKTIILEKREDASLIGGIVSQVGDVVYDGSVRTNLERIKQELLAK